MLTGATGFVGRTLLSRLQSQFPEWSITAITRRGTLPDAGVNTTWVAGSLEDERSLEKALRGAQTVIHAAALLSTGDPGRFFQVNAVAAGTLARVAREAGVERFVLLSSSGVYGGPDFNGVRTEETEVRPESPYARSKYEGEQRVRDALETRATVTILRPTGVYGPGRDLYRELLNSMTGAPFTWLYRGDEIVHPGNINDVVDSVVAVVENSSSESEIFNVAGERAVGLEALKTALCEMAGIRRKAFVVPGFVARPVLLAARGTGLLDDDAAALALEKASGRFPSTEVSTAKIRKRFLLEWTPMATGLAEMVASFGMGVGP
jgi:nucleoside-diphosphate-sugar epimerase